MKKKLLMIFIVIISFALMTIFLFQPDVEASPAIDYDGSVYDLSSFSDDSYEDYLLNFPNEYSNQTITIDATQYLSQSNTFNDEVVEVMTIDNETGLFIPETVKVTWKITVPEAGLYNIKIKYMAVSGRSAEISKGILINDVVPFKEAEVVSFTRIWEDSFDVESVRVDGKHDIKPSQQEKLRWVEEPIRDRAGYYQGDSYKFYFEEGENTFSFTQNKEPMLIQSITLYHEEEVLSYQDTINQYLNQNIEKIDTNLLIENGYFKIQGENSYEKSSPILAPVANWSSYKVDPYESFIMRYNTIGGVTWRVAGDWISWQVNVPKSGLYQLTFKVSQNFTRGMTATRRLTINNEVPFTEAKNLEFAYQSDWQNVTLGNNEGSYWFYLEEGINTITLEATIGIYSEIVKRAEEAISILNTLYRRVVMIAGTNPDQYQDYLLYKRIDGLGEMISEAKLLLEEAMEDIVNVTGERGSLLSSFEKTVYQLNQFEKSEKKIQVGLNELDDNISALGTWVMSISQQSLAIDCIYVHGESVKLPKPNTNFLQKLWHEVEMLFGSYGANTSLESNVIVDGPKITVWIMSGRDQSQLLRQLIDEQFTVQNNINVELKLVAGEALLPATLSGNGPDVAIGVGQNLPVNWGIRNAVVDISKFDDFEAVSTWFHPSALTPFSFRDKVYALPDTQDFLISFVRTDIMNELNLTVPESWNEVIDMLPTLQRQYLDFYLPNTKGSLSPLLYAMIVQNGGQLYEEDGKSILLLESKAQEAFIDFTTFFSDYGFAISASFANRFRSGEMPIGVTNYTLYNTLSVFAPEIRGQWEFANFPGYEIDGEIHNQTTSISTGSIILSSTKEESSSWEFLKWWTGAEAQTAYARGMEAILGAAARYPTANLEAFKNLPWSTKDYLILSEQRNNSVGIPTVPGDYIIGRHIDNAFRVTINEKTNPRENLFEYVKKINIELERKRQEFNLD